jgi:hypothetical protein
MFGHQNDQDDQQHDDNQAISQSVDGVMAAEPAAHDDFNPALPAPSPSFTTPDPIGTPIAPTAPDAPSLDTPAVPSEDEDDEPAAAPTGPLANDDLLDIKQQALTQLSPLVSHLDQSPEEKFRTTMMMIQASDNQALVKEAYAAAQQITDEKAKAQALLDIVNEINYFTQHHAK